MVYSLYSTLHWHFHVSIVSKRNKLLSSFGNILKTIYIHKFLFNRTSTNLLKTSRKRFKKRPENVLKTSRKRFKNVQKRSWRRFKNVPKNVQKRVLKTSRKRFKNVLKTSRKRSGLWKWTFLGPFLDVFKTSRTSDLDVLKTFLKRLCAIWVHSIYKHMYNIFNFIIYIS